MVMTGKNPEVLREELDPVPLYPIWISHNIVWAQFFVSAQLKYSVSVAKTNQLMLFRELIAVCSEIHIKRTSTLCG
jgi:hypothetical protein